MAQLAGQLGSLSSQMGGVAKLTIPPKNAKIIAHYKLLRKVMTKCQEENQLVSR